MLKRQIIDRIRPFRENKNFRKDLGLATYLDTYRENIPEGFNASEVSDEYFIELGDAMIAAFQDPETIDAITFESRPNLIRSQDVSPDTMARFLLLLIADEALFDEEIGDAAAANLSTLTNVVHLPGSTLANPRLERLKNRIIQAHQALIKKYFFQTNELGEETLREPVGQALLFASIFIKMVDIYRRPPFGGNYSDSLRFRYEEALADESRNAETLTLVKLGLTNLLQYE